MEGALVDLMSEGAVTGEMIGSFADPTLDTLTLDKLDPGTLADSADIWRTAGERADIVGASLALLAPGGLGVGLLEGANQPLLVYQLFSARPETQLFDFFDAFTGKRISDGLSP
jgi:hypothetical protein